jgi:hypothetical protein
MAEREPMVRALGGLTEVPVGSTVDVDALRERRQRVPGEHFWIIKMVHQVADPAIELDDMTLDLSNLVGVEPITCLWCRRRYISPVQPGPVCQSIADLAAPPVGGDPRIVSAAPHRRTGNRR